jgi:hypothetical protein
MTETVHRIELIKAITICWNIVNEEIVTEDLQGSELGAVKDELRLAGKTLVKSIEGRFDIEQELELLTRVDLSVSELFGIDG